jgi:hypothetical protein
MIMMFWEDAAVTVQSAPLEDEKVLVLIAAPTLPDGSMGDLISMTAETARNLRNRLDAALRGL